MYSGRLPDDLAATELAVRLEAAKARAGAIDLTVSNPTACGVVHPPAVQRALVDACAVTGYEAHAGGARRARQAVADYLGCGLGPEQVFLCCSTSEAYSVLLKLLCDPGDAVAVPTPSYPLIPHLAELECVETPTYAWIRRGGAWHLDLAAAQRLLAAGVRAFVLVSPNNPTGAVVSQDDLGRLRELCAAAKVPLIIDEVFRPYGHDAALPTLARPDGPLTFVLDGLSKAVALPQLKLSWIAVCADARERREVAERLEWVLDAYLSLNGIVERALPALLGAAPSVQGSIRERVRNNLRQLEHAVAALPGAAILSTRAGWYAVLQLDARGDDEQWALELAERHGVLVQPGYYYDLPEGRCLVVSLLPSPADFARAAGLLSAYVRQLAQ